MTKRRIVTERGGKIASATRNAIKTKIDALIVGEAEAEIVKIATDAAAAEVVVATDAAPAEAVVVTGAAPVARSAGSRAARTAGDRGARVEIVAMANGELRHRTESPLPN